MEKLLTFPGRTERGIFNYVIGGGDQTHLVKTAAEYHPEIAAYIRNAEARQGVTQVLLTALGAGEYWGPNVNGDWFGEDDLAYPGEEYGHKTFVSMAKVFKHHINKPNSPHYGKVLVSVYNPKYRRVELIVEIDNVSGKDIVDRINAGDLVEWSMGCKVKFDICSICRNKAPTTKHYCSHLKYYLGQIDPETGKHVFAINPKPRFFDISYVLIGADKTAKTLLKVASGMPSGPAISSALLAEKRAEMEKEVPADPGDNAPDSATPLEAMVELRAREKDIPNETLDSLATKFPVDKILSSMMMLGFVPKPREVQRIIIAQAGKRDVADSLDQAGITFDPEDDSLDNLVNSNVLGKISFNNFDEVLAKNLYDMVPQRSGYSPHLTRRMLEMMVSMPEPQRPVRLIKIGSVLNGNPNPFEDMNEDAPAGVGSSLKYIALAAILHKAMQKKAPEQTMLGLGRLIKSNPGLAAALGIGAGATLAQLFGSSHRLKGNDSFDMVPEIPTAAPETFKIAAAAVPRELKKFLGGTFGAYTLSSGLERRRRSDPEYNEGFTKRFLRKNPDVITGLMAFDALQGLQGKGSTGLYHRAGGAAKTIVNPILKRFTKMAAEQNRAMEKTSQSLSNEPKKSSTAKDILSSTVIWPLAFGRAALPARMLGGALDMAAFNVGKKVLSKKPEKPKI